MDQITQPSATAEPVASVFVSAGDGLKLHARDYGIRWSQALPVVCLPGLARTARDFDRLARHLAFSAKRTRRVVALDYRGRGLSDYDKDWKNYDIRVELGDVMQVLTALGIERAVFVGTSRGGIITMALSAARPGAIAGAVLNDIGGAIDAKGLMRIRGYVGKMPMPRTFAEGGAILKSLFSAQFTAMTDEDWEDYARLTWHDRDGDLKPDYDVALMKGLQALDLEKPLPPLWPYFEGLKGVPVMVLRGENSDLLSQETVAEMGSRHPRLDAVTVANQGHAPLLAGRDLLTKIQRFVARC